MRVRVNERWIPRNLEFKLRAVATIEPIDFGVALETLQVKGRASSHGTGMVSAFAQRGVGFGREYGVGAAFDLVVLRRETFVDHATHFG